MELKQDYSSKYETSFDQNLGSGNFHQVSGDMLGQDFYQVGGGGFQFAGLAPQQGFNQVYQSKFLNPQLSYGNFQIAQQPLNSYALGPVQQIQSGFQSGFIGQAPIMYNQSQGFVENQAQPIGYIVGEPMVQYQAQNYAPSSQILYNDVNFGGQMVYQQPQNQYAGLVSLPSNASYSNYQVLNQPQQPVIYGGEQIQFQGFQPAIAPQYTLGQQFPMQSYGGYQVMQAPQYDPLQGVQLRSSFNNFQFANQPQLGAGIRYSYANQPSLGAYSIQNPLQYNFGGIEQQPLRASLGARTVAPSFIGGGYGGFNSAQLPISSLNGPNFVGGQRYPIGGAQLGAGQVGGAQFGNQPHFNHNENVPTFASQNINKPVLGGPSVEGVSLNKNREFDSLPNKR